ncbi:exo-poly-alpha-D-galacturonosidase [Polaribacter reichenbachii]|uniref:Exo-poly-alpha-D-galacturonosidase n=1 Tax=Polaribacter reichenbachii TaxID=996801 RepID=A0A1B8U6Q4_9FLAO|nr:glycosyl hydrolase family 28 protein [Polaribacter reichenbachii]APZ46076.1 exo-poly-alpha-D-galacturonosidase [Polaribacter reichenbachii]AUC19938.1 exo-poly-alpha-D-galacturonosidase [Polaribacter reichenbachii]OBY67517.1 exo-poly-alpha-D-galacturonosidase [Polaribacter reichenbachii]
MKNLNLILVALLIISCGREKKSRNITFKPDWINQVGSQDISVKSKTYFVNDFGAKGDEKTLNTDAIQQAINECSKNGGGIVTFKPGVYLTGSIFIKSNIKFIIPKGTEIKGSENIKDYKEIDTRIAGIEMEWPAALINIRNQKNVSLEGEGIIDGQGKVHWDYYWDLRKNDYEPRGLRWIVDYDAKRPRTVLVSNSKNIFVKDLNIKRAGFWTVQILYSEYITVDGLLIQNNIGGHGPSTDGIDIDSSKWILVQNCDIDCNDDNFCLKAGRDWDGQRVNKSTEYVVIKDCIARQGAGLFTLGSETSGSIRHVYVSNIKGLGTKNGLNIKSATNRGGTVEDIYMENIQMDTVRTFIEVSMNWNPNYSYSKLPKEFNPDSIPVHWKKMLKKVEPEKGIPTFKNITINNVNVKGAKKAINVNGMEKSIIKNFTLNDVSISAETAGSINYSENWTLNNVKIITKDSTKVVLKNTSKINFNDDVYSKKDGSKIKN